MKGIDLGSDEYLIHQFLHKGRRMRARAHIRPEAKKRRDKVKRRVQNAMRKSVSGSDARRILDVGTGFGSNARLLAEILGGRGKIWSIDPSLGVLREVERILKAERILKHVKLIQAKAEDLPFRDGFFSLVTSAMLVHHLVNAHQGLREMVRVLAKGGMLVLVDWRPVTSEVVPHQARDFVAPEKILQILTQSGVSVKLRKYRYWYLIQGKR